MPWEPITTVEQLAARFESSSLDYKTEYDLSTPDRCEMAKDVAAFANAYGGAVVVGLKEVGGKIVRVSGVSDVPKLTNEVAAALRDHCVPVPATPAEHSIIVRPADAARLHRPISRGVSAGCPATRASLRHTVAHRR